MKSQFISLLFLSLLFESLHAEDENHHIQQFFIKTIKVAINNRVSQVAMDDVDADAAVTFIMSEIKKNFGAIREDGIPSEEESVVLKKLGYSMPPSKIRVTCNSKDVNLSSIIDSVCLQLGYILVIEPNGSLNFISEKISLERDKYDVYGKTYIRNHKKTDKLPSPPNDNKPLEVERK